MLSERADRVARVNAILMLIASTGRKFFRHKTNVSRFELDQRGRVWFVDHYSQKRIYTHGRNGRWPGFTNGGTMLCLCKAFQRYIMGKPFDMRNFGPWDHSYLGGDPWAYGFENMRMIRKAARKLLA